MNGGFTPMTNQENNSIEVTGKSLDETLEIAALRLSCKSNEIEYEVIKETKPSIFSLFSGTKITIKAWAKKQSQAKDKQSAHHQNSHSKLNWKKNKTKHHQDTHSNSSSPAQVSKNDIEKIAGAYKTFCKGVADRMTKESSQVNCEIIDSTIKIDIENKVLGEMQKKNSHLAEAIEHLMRKIPSNHIDPKAIRVILDIAGSREDREKELIQVAKESSDQVHQNQKPIVLNYRNAYDRKIIHMFLDKDDRVYTKSVGTGNQRKLMILPNKNGQKKADKEIAATAHV